jgi:hypothetical protein
MSARTPRAARRLVLTGIAVSLCATALLAIGILLFGDFGETEGRILGTTMLLAGYGLLALPAGFLLDQSRHRALAGAVIALTATALALNLIALWSGGGSAALGKSVGTVTFFAVAASQTGALSARRRATDPSSVSALFVFSCGLALFLAVMATAVVWAEPHGQVYLRILGALAVLDVLLVALQPVLALALARPRGEVYHLRVGFERGDELETDVVASDFAAAASRAIRETERAGRRVRQVARV